MSALSHIQRAALLVLFDAEGPVRGGYAPRHRIASGTGGSLVKRGLARHVDDMPGDRRGSYFEITEDGRRVARKIRETER